MTKMTNEEWRKKLSPEQYRVLREKGTEPPFSGELVHHKGDGMYVCAGCGQELFTSETKYDSGSGWPSFLDVAEKGNVELREDTSHGMMRTEVLCAGCGGHLGHVFYVGNMTETGEYYCINSCALGFKEKS